MEPKGKKYPEGHFIGLWMAIGIAIFSGLGIPLSIATENYAFIGIGPSLGIAIGLVIGQAIENKYKEERRRTKVAILVGLALLLVGVVVFLLLFFSII